LKKLRLTRQESPISYSVVLPKNSAGLGALALHWNAVVSSKDLCLIRPWNRNLQHAASDQRAPRFGPSTTFAGGRRAQDTELVKLHIVVPRPLRVFDGCLKKEFVPARGNSGHSPRSRGSPVDGVRLGFRMTRFSTISASGTTRRIGGQPAGPLIGVVRPFLSCPNGTCPGDNYQ
jgi:hypothetical protein